MKRFLLVLLLASSLPAAAQRFSLGTNTVDWLCLGTLNAEASVATITSRASLSRTAFSTVNTNNRHAANPRDFVRIIISTSSAEKQRTSQS